MYFYFSVAVACSMQLALLTKVIFVVDSKLGLNITIVFAVRWSIDSDNTDLACSEAWLAMYSATNLESVPYNTNTSSL